MIIDEWQKSNVFLLFGCCLGLLINHEMATDDNIIMIQFCGRFCETLPTHPTNVEVVF